MVMPNPAEHSVAISDQAHFLFSFSLHLNIPVLKPNPREPKMIDLDQD
jgi:hypothetical protein